MDYHITFEQREEQFFLKHDFDKKDPTETYLGKREILQWIERGNYFLASGSSLSLKRDISSKKRESASVSLAEALGQEIYDATLGAAESYFEVCRALARERNEEVVIGMRYDSDSLLHEVPWELMHRRSGHGAIHEAEIVRIPLLAGESLHDGLGVQGPVRVLITTAEPSTYCPLGVNEELDHIRQSLEQCGRETQLETKQRIDRKSLCHYVQNAEHHRRPFHIWLHSGHGAYEKGEFHLVLHNGQKEDLVPLRNLEFLVAGHTGLRMVLLNVCYGGVRQGLAPALAKLNIPATLAYPTAILDQHAMIFSKKLMSFLPHESLTTALKRARIALSTEWEPLAWALPQLYSRYRNSGVIWPQFEERLCKKPQNLPTHQGGVTVNSSNMGDVNLIFQTTKRKK